VGGHTLTILNEMGIEVIGDILRLTQDELENRLANGVQISGTKHRGCIMAVFSEWHEAKSYQLKYICDQYYRCEFLLSELVRMTEKIAFELRQESKLAGCIAVKIRYPDLRPHQNKLQLIILSGMMNSSRCDRSFSSVI
jgi:DNA polymerase-4